MYKGEIFSTLIDRTWEREIFDVELGQKELGPTFTIHVTNPCTVRSQNEDYTTSIGNLKYILICMYYSKQSDGQHAKEEH